MKHDLIDIELNVINNKVKVIKFKNINYISLAYLARYKCIYRKYWSLEWL